MARDTIATNICQAVETIVSRRLSQAGYDKTVKCTVETCKDEETGKYTVNYAGAKFTAYAIGDMKYEDGTEVYMLVPANDWTRQKSIIGSVSRSVTQTKKSKDTAAGSYNTLGGSVITNTWASYDNIPSEWNEHYQKLSDGTMWIKLSSYENDTKIVYEYQKFGKGYIDLKLAEQVIPQGDCLILGATIEKRLHDITQDQIHGNYGIRVKIAFQSLSDDAADGDLIYRTYTLSAMNTIPGNIDSIPKPTYFEHVFYDNIDLKQFDHIEKVQVFTENYPADEEAIKKFKNDIRIKNIVLKSVAALTETERDNYSLNISYPKGLVLASKDTTLPLKAQFKKTGTIVTQNVEYYWFRENGSITISSLGYHKLGGPGWECLNPVKYSGVTNKKLLARVQGNFVTNCADITAAAVSDDFQNKQFSVKQRYLKIKCVAVCNNIETATGYLLLQNNNVENIKIVTSEKLADGSNKINYYHGLTNKASGLTLTCEVYDEKDVKQDPSAYSYSWIVISASEVDEEKSANQTKYQYTKFPMQQVVSSVLVYCTVKDGDTYIGTGSITLYNTNELSDSYNLIITNGDQVFQYNDDGISPTAQSVENKLQILPLTFTLIDPDGNEIGVNDLKRNGAEIVWSRPVSNTLITSGTENDDKTQYTFTIADTYDVNKTDNIIKLQIKYHNVAFDAYTNFSFLKSGDVGTNGTNYAVKIYPKDSSTQRVYISNEDNYMFGDNGQKIEALNVKVYKNSQEVKAANYSHTRSIVKNQETWLASAKYQSLLNTSYITVSDLISKRPCDIIRETIDIKEQGDDLVYYAEYPIIINRIQDGLQNSYRIKVKPLSGYIYVKYKSDGTMPTYRQKAFTIIVEKNIDGTNYEEDTDSNLKFEWHTIGNFAEAEYNNSATNTVTPLATFDGLRVDNAIYVIVSRGNTVIGYIHIPIYMYLNRYQNSALNIWDGNSIQLGDGNGGTILAPQVGAGQKEEDNSFTGVVIGKENTDNSEQVGLFAYGHGQRSVFIDANTGKAYFGANNKGQIIIDPTDTTAKIYGGNYDTTAGTGMIIDLSTPEIKFGSNNFSVNKNGHLTAKGGGTIAGWSIGNYVLHSDNWNVGLNSDPNQYNSFAFWAGAGSGETRPFWVKHDGSFKSTKGTIGGWTIANDRLYAGGNGTDGSAGITLTSDGAIKGGAGLNNTNVWQIKPSGEATFNNIIATGGTIGGIKIQSNGLYPDNSKWKIRSDGTADFTGISINGEGLQVNQTANKIIINSNTSSGTSTSSSGGIGFAVDGTKTLNQWFHELYTQSLFSNNITNQIMYSRHIRLGDYRYTTTTVEGVQYITGITDTSLGNIRLDLQTSGIDPAIAIYSQLSIRLISSSNVVFTGQSKTIEFSDGSYLNFSKGILVGGMFYKDGVEQSFGYAGKMS